MKITKQRLKQLIKEELENLDKDGDADDAAELHDAGQEVEELVGDLDFYHSEVSKDNKGFFASLVDMTGNFLDRRKDELADELKQACIRVLLDAKSNAYKSNFPSR
ncbi:MAG: hypothetical protein CL554_19555 [Algoriphagus sp.]|uniref:hypothetical protein n=1 Tax=Algoriphagus sp. TaxID=1872435 RepID=UPI000C3A7112|nr:hypothetical protein [Algoriphagus sp.]MAL15610.1 hypothetical protein [Algoriphagus sp.]|tara:strand:- start:74 stop:391 length:318 start_codon:yes stop_codon:yes gene_type:complete